MPGVSDEDRQKGARVYELRGASKGNDVAFLTFSKCAELVMCTFQFISPTKLSPTFIFHSRQ